MIKLIRIKFFYRLILIVFLLIIVFAFIILHVPEKSPTDVSSEKSVIYNKTLLNKINAANSYSALFNEDEYDKLNDDNLVIVVQVHNRLNYLKALIRSLSKVQNINETLIVFSHDYYDDNINNLIKHIPFAKVSQIFFPFSIQIWANTFPGTSPNDCLRSMSKQKASSVNCTNHAHPDTYGHYRESHVTQTKHHWWWKLNYVMDHFVHTKDHHGDFVLVEEDHYFSPDFLHCWKLMKQLKKSLLFQEKQIDLLTLGNYKTKSEDVFKLADKLYLMEWFSSQHNMAFTMDKVLWSKIKLCQNEFCTYDDYNWDWSLQFVSSRCFQKKLQTLVPIVARVHHIGTCGLHHKNSECDIQNVIAKKDTLFYGPNKKYYFPRNFSVTYQAPIKHSLKNNGGWGDTRDHELCNQLQLTYKDIISLNSNFVEFN